MAYRNRKRSPASPAVLTKDEQERYVRLLDQHPEWVETVERRAGRPVAAMTYQQKVFALAELLKDEQLTAALAAKARVAAKAPELLVNELLTRLSRQPAANDPPESQALLCDLVDVVRHRRAA